MQIPVPKTAAPIVRITLQLPDGSKINSELMPTIDYCEIELPEGVDESEVGVTVAELNNANQVVSSAVIKYATEKPIEVPADEPAVEDEPTDEVDTDLEQEAD